ncbi:hypothetical protein ENBRE01_3338 [Enteropsectra breve]|nr:hypothetical protein ENBRE01_3338 [Enteropsectra breve]
MVWTRKEELYKNVITGRITTNEQLMSYFIVEGLEVPFCSPCEEEMKIRKRAVNYIDFRCRRCDKFKRITFFNAFSNIEPIKYIKMIAYFAAGLNQNTISEFTEIGTTTICSIVLDIQRAINTLIVDKEPQIGGPGHIVQIDESHFGKRKNNRGRTNTEQWIFGGIDVVTNDIFMKVVPNRRKETLGPLIEKHIAHGSDVHSDKHKTYLSFFKTNPNYNYSYVNHELHFVDPVTGVHTQDIESLWSQFKRWKNAKGYKKCRYLPLYLSEFKLRHKYKLRKDIFFSIILNLLG